MSDVILQAESLNLTIGSQTLLADAGFALHAGERVGVVGRNGAGKSTLLRILADQVHPDGGNVSRRRGLSVEGLQRSQFAGCVSGGQ